MSLVRAFSLFPWGKLEKIAGAGQPIRTPPAYRATDPMNSLTIAPWWIKSNGKLWINQAARLGPVFKASWRFLRRKARIQRRL